MTAFAYTETMETIKISDTENHCRYIAYIASALSSRQPSARIHFESGRVVYTAETAGDIEPLRQIAEDKIADVICIGYKYAELNARTHVTGLSKTDKEILLTGIIAADYAEDKRFVLARLSTLQRQHTIDGFYDFRIKELREKWEEIAACIPPVFTQGHLQEFMQYILSGNHGKVYLKGNEVYDSHCRRLRRSALIEGAQAQTNVMREIILSGAQKINCIGIPSPEQECFLRRFYEGNITF